MISCAPAVGAAMPLPHAALLVARGPDASTRGVGRSAPPSEAVSPSSGAMSIEASAAPAAPSRLGGEDSPPSPPVSPGGGSGFGGEDARSAPHASNPTRTRDEGRARKTA